MIKSLSDSTLSSVLAPEKVCTTPAALWDALPLAWQSALVLAGGPHPREALERAAAAALADQEKGDVFPSSPTQWLNALMSIPEGPAGVRVAIVGQDPYHGPGQAMGLSFSVAAGVRFPPSLRNILKELQSDIQAPLPTSGDLSPWAQQGVLLLNAALTVKSGQANSHALIGWDAFTEWVLIACAQDAQAKIFVGWGAFAQKRINTALAAPGARVWPTVYSVHPSPLSAHRGFLGSRPFSTINAYLMEMGRKPLNWVL